MFAGTGLFKPKERTNLLGVGMEYVRHLVHLLKRLFFAHDFERAGVVARALCDYAYSDVHKRARRERYNAKYAVSCTTRLTRVAYQAVLEVLLRQENMGAVRTFSRSVLTEATDDEVVAMEMAFAYMGRGHYQQAYDILQSYIPVFIRNPLLEGYCGLMAHALWCTSRLNEEEDRDAMAVDAAEGTGRGRGGSAGGGGVRSSGISTVVSSSSPFGALSGDVDELCRVAIKHLTRANSLMPTCNAFAVPLAELHVSDGDIDLARRLLKTFVTSNPNDPAGMRAYAVFLMDHADDPKTTVACLKKLSALDPASVVVMDGLVQLYSTGALRLHSFLSLVSDRLDYNGKDINAWCALASSLVNGGYVVSMSDPAKRSAIQRYARARPTWWMRLHFAHLCVEAENDAHILVYKAIAFHILLQNGCTGITPRTATIATAAAGAATAETAATTATAIQTTTTTTTTAATTTTSFTWSSSSSSPPPPSLESTSAAAAAAADDVAFCACVRRRLVSLGFGNNRRMALISEQFGHVGLDRDDDDGGGGGGGGGDSSRGDRGAGDVKGELAMRQMMMSLLSSSDHLGDGGGDQR